jgi:hypothetical protein
MPPTNALVSVNSFGTMFQAKEKGTKLMGLSFKTGSNFRVLLNSSSAEVIKIELNMFQLYALLVLIKFKCNNG